MDKVTLSPDQDGYSFTDGEETLRAVLDGNAGRYSPSYYNAAITLNCQWTCDREEFEYMRGVYRTHVDEGHAPFPIDLVIESGLKVEYQVIIVPGTFGLKSQRGHMYVLGATISVQPLPKARVTGPLPKLALPISPDGYSFTDTAETYYQAVDGGLGRTVRDLLGASTLINVQWQTDMAGFLYLREFYRNWVTSPRDGFPIDVIIDEADPTEKLANFVPNTMGLTSINGHTFIVKAQIEALDGPWPRGVGTEKTGCDCSHIAWLTGFETESDFMDIGDGVVVANGDGEGSGRSPALYQDASLLLGFDSSDYVEFTNPEVAVGADWTVRWSMKAASGAYLPAEVPLLRAYNSEENEEFSILADHDDAADNGFKLFVVYQGANFGFAFPLSYDETHDLELNADDGHLRFFADGVLLYEYADFEPTVDVVKMRWLDSVYHNGTRLDEVRVQNIVEHTETYAVNDLPFCRCEHEEPAIPDGITIETRGPSFWLYATGDVATRIGASTVVGVEDPTTLDPDESSSAVTATITGEGKLNILDEGIATTGSANSTRQNVGSGAYDFGLEIVVGYTTPGLDFAFGLVAYGFAPVDKNSWLYGYETMIAGIVQKELDSTCYVTGYGGVSGTFPKLLPGDVVHMIGYGTFDVYINGVNIFAIAQPANSAQAAPFVSYKGIGA